VPCLARVLLAGPYYDLQSLTVYARCRSKPLTIPYTMIMAAAAAGLEEAGRVRRGDTVLVTAAAGGTGQFAVQLAAAAGATVVATCGGPAKAALLRRLGAARVIDYHQERVKDVLKREFPKARLCRPMRGCRFHPVWAGSPAVPADTSCELSAPKQACRAAGACSRPCPLEQQRARAVRSRGRRRRRCLMQAFD